MEQLPSEAPTAAWERDEDEDMMIAYGPLAALLCRRVRERRLFLLSNQDAFLRKFLEFYVSNMKGIGTSKGCYESTRNLVAILPSAEQCLQFVEAGRHKRDTVFLKVVIDVLEHYYKQTEAPLFVRYREKVVPLALAFYRSLSPAAVLEVGCEIRAATARIGTHTDLNDNDVEEDRAGFFLIKKTRKEYVDYYTNEMMTYENLVAGNCRDTYYS